jgi:hypothetical protein
MSNCHEPGNKLGNLNIATLDQHLDETLAGVRAEFEYYREVHSRFECVTDGESFNFVPNWPEDRGAKAAVCAVLRDSFRRRGVNRFVFASEGCVGKKACLTATDDPDHGECVLVIAVERNGSRKCAGEIQFHEHAPPEALCATNGDVPFFCSMSRRAAKRVLQVGD